MKIVKIAEFDNKNQRMSFAQAQAAVKKHGCRLMTKEEWLALKGGQKTYYRYWPFWLQGGLLARVGFGDFRRGVGAYFRPSVRCGVLGVKLDGKKHKHVWECSCGAKR